MKRDSQNIIFFDGRCKLCNRFIQFIFKRDKKHCFFYAPLQGTTAQSVVEEKDIHTLKSIVVLKNGHLFKESQAIEEIVSDIYPKTIWLLTLLSRIRLPSRWHYSFYNMFYRLVAKNRYQWFGKSSQMYQPTEVQNKYFLP